MVEHSTGCQAKPTSQGLKQRENGGQPLMTLAGEHLSCQDEQMMEKKVQTQGAVFCIPVAGTV